MANTTSSRNSSVYKPLPTTRSIRLLTISPGNYGGAIDTVLEVVDLDSSEIYEAMCYISGKAWPPNAEPHASDDITPPIRTEQDQMISEDRSLAPVGGDISSIPQVDIVCNGESMRVSQTLADTLQRLRYQEWSRPKHTRARKLWVYLLCVNQEDLNERAQQLSIIRDVYARASKVLVWLGQDTGDVQPDSWAELPVQKQDSVASIDTTARFTYSDLEDGEFRLLTVIGMRADKVICELAHTAIAHAPDFDALSYTWGENIPAVICCNGHELVVQQNLFQFLKQLASNTDFASPRRHIWIDAICINQADVKEKGRQIPLMKDIYSTASRVLVWLGQAEKGSDLAMDSLEHIITKLEHLPIDAGAAYVGMLGLDIYNPLWPALGHLFRRAWFRRLWVVQEVALGKRIIVLCGDRSTDWETFVRANSCLQGWICQQLIRDSATAEDSFVDGQRDFLNEIQLIRASIAKGEFYPLCHLWYVAQLKECTHLADYVWGMLGIMDEADRRHILDTAPYSSENHIETWLCAAKWTLQKEEYFTYMLSLAEMPQKSSELPSWCPDFSKPQQHLSWHIFQRYYQAGSSPSEHKHPFSIKFYLRDLHVRGFQVDEVKAVTSSLVHSPDRPKGAARRFREWEMECRDLSHEAGTKMEDVSQAHMRTLIAGSLGNGTLFAGDLSKNFRSWLRTQASMEIAEMGMQEIAQQYEKDLEVRDFKYSISFQRACPGRVYFTTRGRRLGLGSSRLQPGDWICIFHGASVPFALRRSGEGGRFSSLGDAYVDGLMSGEAYTANDRGQEQEFVVN